jgi:predicted nucleic acid-binding protein
MLAIDASIVIRFLTRDHEAVARRALEIVSNNDMFVPVAVILEAEWVLRDVCEMPRDEVISQLRRFCGLERVTAPPRSWRRRSTTPSTVWMSPTLGASLKRLRARRSSLWTILQPERQRD